MKYRVVQWTTGKIAQQAVRGIILHPELELIGCYAYSAEKVGVDVGTLCGLDPIGLAATGDIDALIAMKPDCISYMQYMPDWDLLARFLESGINVVTLYQLFKFDEHRDRLEAAARRGKASMFSSGIYPGHVNNVAMAASAMCSRVDSISHLESLDLSSYENEQMFRDQGFDGEPDNPAVSATCAGMVEPFKYAVQDMAAKLRLPIDDVTVTFTFATADDDIDLGFMVIRKGRVAGIMGTVAAVADGQERIKCSFVWMMGLTGMTPALPIAHGYAIEIKGEPDVKVTLARVEGVDRSMDFQGVLSVAMPALNAIPDVCRAGPGILNSIDIPFVTASMGAVEATGG